MNRYITVIVIVTLLGLGCIRKIESPPRELNFVLIGVDLNNPPFEFLDSLSAEPVGFDLDLLSLICKANDWQFEFVPTPHDRLLDDLTQKELDIAIGRLVVPEDPGLVVNYSDPYYLTGLALAVPADDSITIDIGKLRGKRVGVVAGSSSEEFLRENYGLQTYPCNNLSLGLTDVVAGRFDAVVDERTNLRFAMSLVEGVKLVPGTLNSEYYGIAMRTSDSLRLQKVNDALAALVGGYSFEQLHLKWFGYPILDITIPDTVAAQWDAD